MPTTVTMTSPMRSENGLSILLAGQQYTVSDEYAAYLIRTANVARDTFNVNPLAAAVTELSVGQVAALSTADTRGVQSRANVIDATYYNPTVTHGTVIDGADPAGTYRYNHAPALAFFSGLWYCMWSANANDDENQPGQYLVQSTSADFVTWSAPVRVFCNAAFTSNPITDTGTNIQWQPGLIVAGGQLLCYWHEQAPTSRMWVGKLAAGGGKWSLTNLSLTPITVDTVVYNAGFTSGNPIQLPSGRILCPITLTSASVDSTAVGVGTVGNGAYRICSAIISDDNGATHRIGGAVTNERAPWSVFEPMFCMQPDGLLRMYCRNMQLGPETPASSNIAFTGALTAATSGTLSVAPTVYSGAYQITFSDGSVRQVSITNGSTAVIWSGAVTATANAVLTPLTYRGRFLMTATSANQGDSWGTLRATGLNTSIARPGIINGGDQFGTKYLLHNDFEGESSWIGMRRNLTLYVGSGANDFVPMIPITGNFDIPGMPEAYAQGVLKDGSLYIVASVYENSWSASTFYSHIVPILPSAGAVSPRGAARCMNSAPEFKSDPVRYKFGGDLQKFSAVGSTTGWATNRLSGAITLDSRKLLAAVLWDNRDAGNTAGCIVGIGFTGVPTDKKVYLRYTNAGALVLVDSGLSVPALGGKYFLAWAVDAVALTFTVWIVNSAGTLSTASVAIPGLTNLNGSTPFLGSPRINTASTLPSFLGDIYRYRVWDIAFTLANVTAIYEVDRIWIGLPFLAGTQTFPGGVRLLLTNTDIHAGTNNATWLANWSALGGLSGDVTQIADGTVNALKIAGNASCGWSPVSDGASRGVYQLRYKAPAGRANDIGIITIGNPDDYIEITKIPAAAGTLQVRRAGYLDSTTVLFLLSANSSVLLANDVYYGLQVSFRPGTVTIMHSGCAPMELPFDGAPVVYLGRAHNVLNLTTALATDFVLVDQNSLTYGETGIRDAGLKRAAQSGTWAPVLQFGGASVGITYATGLQTGFWYRIGDMVFWSFDLSLSSKGSSTGSATIANFPFQGLSGNGANNAQGGHAVFATGMSASAGGGTITGTLAATSMTLRIMTAGAAVTLADTDFGGTARMRMQGWFMTVDPTR